MTSEVRFCPRCGTQAAFQAAPNAVYGAQTVFRPYDRVARNIQILGTMWLVYAALRFFTGLLGMLFLHGFLRSHFFEHSDFNMGWSPFGAMWLASLWPMAFFSLTISVGCAVLTGYALMTRQVWGRVVGIIFGILALFHPPLGTVLGIYTLWVLASRLSGDEYANVAYAQHGR